MSKEAGELYPTALPQAQRASIGYSRAPPSSQADTVPDLAAEDSAEAASDTSLIAARHRHQEAKENISSALNPAYSYAKVCHFAVECCFGLEHCCFIGVVVVGIYTVHHSMLED